MHMAIVCICTLVKKINKMATTIIKNLYFIQILKINKTK